MENHLAAGPTLLLGLYIKKVKACNVHKVHSPCPLTASDLVVSVLLSFMVFLQPTTQVQQLWSSLYTTTQRRRIWRKYLFMFNSHKEKINKLKIHAIMWFLNIYLWVSEKRGKRIRVTGKKSNSGFNFRILTFDLRILKNIKVIIYLPITSCLNSLL